MKYVCSVFSIQGVKMCVTFSRWPTIILLNILESTSTASGICTINIYLFLAPDTPIRNAVLLNTDSY